MRRTIPAIAILLLALVYLASAAYTPAGAGTSHTKQVSTTTLVKAIDLDSHGITVRLATGQKMRLDLGAMTGPGGQLNYFGWGMLMFGLSIAMRLLSTIGRVFQPILGRGRRDRER